MLESGDTIRAAWPLVYGKSRREITMPPLTQKLGVLFAPSTAKYARRLSEEIRLVQKLLGEIPEKTIISQCFHESFQNWLPFYWEGFKQTTRYTHVFNDLSDIDNIRAGMIDGCKGMLKKAEKLGVEAIESDDLEKMMEINQRSFTRQGIKFPFSFDFVERIDKACLENAGRRILLSVDPSGAIHSCDYMIYDSQCAISLLQGADPKYRDSGAQRYLDWNSIQFAATVSKKFDFEGSMMPGVELYNRGFGARQMPYFGISGKRKDPKDRSFRTRCRRFAARGLRYLARAIET